MLGANVMTVRKKRLEQLLEIAQRYKACSRNQQARTVGRDPTRLVPKTGTLDLGRRAQGIAASSEQRARAFNRRLGALDGLGRHTVRLQTRKQALQESSVSPEIRRMLQTNLADACYSLWSLIESGAIAQSLLGWYRANSPQTPVDRKIHAFARYVSGHTRRRLISLMIQLVAIVPLMTASRTLADPPVRLLLHTDQEDLVRHLNQDGGWQQMLSEPQPVLLQSTPMDPFAVDLRDLLPDPWSHGNSPRMTTLPVRNIPAPGAVFVLGLAGLLGVPARRRRPRVPS